MASSDIDLQAIDEPPERRTSDPNIEGLESRTTASEGQSCQRCEGPIRGRRRNGFCSDKCRRAVRRLEERAESRVLIESLKDIVAELETRLGLGGGHG